MKINNDFYAYRFFSEVSFLKKMRSIPSTLFDKKVHPCFWCGLASEKSILELEYLWGEAPLPSYMANTLFIADAITYKQLPYLMDAYQQMPKQKKVFALGSHALGEGLRVSSYSTVKNIEAYIPIDYFIPGDPVSAHTIIEIIHASRKNELGKI
jgi:hypothetical protein